MSTQTADQMFRNWLSGMESTHGKPWWSNPTTDNPANHFDGPIPLDAVMKLFGFDVNMSRVWVEDHNGTLFLAEKWLACVPDNEQRVFGIHSDSFSVRGHQLREWLIDGPAKVINGEVGMSNAGLIDEGAQAWVNVSTPEEWKTIQGVDFRPQLLFTTSFDGTIPSTVIENEVLSVCDNTRRMALNSGSKLVYRVKHTKNSHFKLDDAKAALRLLESNGNAFAEEIATLCEWTVTESQFDKFMSQLVPLPEQKKELDVNKRDYSTRSATIAANKRQALNELYRLDGRVEPWKGTAFGVLQMVNTYNQHIATQRNAEHRALRNMQNVMTGKSANADNDALAMLAKICDRQLVAA